MGLRRASAVLLLLVGCGREVASELGTAPGATGESSMNPGTSTGTPPGPTCEGIESAAPAPAQLCAIPSVLIGAPGTLATPRVRGLETYGLASVVATSDTFSTLGSDLRNAPWVDGDDVSVGFVAPRGGKWRLSARGIGAHRIVATRSCSTPSSNEWERAFSRSSDAWITTGAELTTEVSIELFAERGERFDVVVDGCARGSRCSYSLYAERLGGLECAAGNPCAASDHCFIDRCDAERYACVPRARLDQLSPGAARAWRDGTSIFVAGAVANWPKNLPPLHRFIRYELLDAAGAVAPHATSYPSTTITDGRFPPARVHLYPRSEVRSVRMSFSDDEHRPVSDPSSVIVIEGPPTPPALGDRCVPGDTLEPCRSGACVLSVGSHFVCSLPPLRVLEANGYSQVYPDPHGVGSSGPMVFMDVVVETATPSGWSGRARDARGVELAWGEVRCDFSEPFATSGTRLACLFPMAHDQLGRVATLELSGTWNGMSVRHDVPVRRLPTVGYGEPCGSRGRFPYLLGDVGRCDEGLTCLGHSCGFPTKSLCSGAEISTWAPTRFPSTVSGVTSGSTSSRSCGSTSGLNTQLVFVAPEAGRYSFTIDGAATATSSVPCSAPGCFGQTIFSGPTALDRGTRVRLEVRTTNATPTFSIRAERSPL
jgi:hypothetical protein